MKKRIISMVLVIVLALSLCVPAAAASTTENVAITYRAIKINLNGEEITPCDAAGKTVEPFIMNSNGTTYLPLRAIGQALGLDVAWDSATSTVTLSSGGKVITGAGAPGSTTGTQNVAITYRDIKVVLDGKQLELKNAAGTTVEPFIMGGTTYLPLRVVGEALGLKVSWDGASNTAILGEAVQDGAATGITLNQKKIWFFPGDTYQLVATVEPADAVNKTVTWTSSDPSVATVSASGLVTMVKVGTANITAKTANGKTAECVVVVQSVAATGITLNQTNVTKFTGELFQLVPTITPANATYKTVTWKSSNTSVATVDQYGWVYIAGQGTATITATTANGLTASCVVKGMKNSAEDVYWIGNKNCEYNDNKEEFTISFCFKDYDAKYENASYVMAPGYADIRIVNDDGETVYSATKQFSVNDFKVSGSQYTMQIKIKADEITGGYTTYGDIYVKVYNPGYYNFNEYSHSVYKLPLAKTTVILPELPITLSEYDYNGKRESSFKITDITYETSGDTLYLYFAGEKTYDEKGSGQSRSCQISWKLYDMEGYVVDSGTVYTVGVAMGEKFRNEKAYVWDIEVGQTYRLEILSTNED